MRKKRTRPLGTRGRRTPLAPTNPSQTTRAPKCTSTNVAHEGRVAASRKAGLWGRGREPAWLEA
eukprot:scaffold109221_cov32-Tisochrysis_lutea.AAC.4